MAPIAVAAHDAACAMGATSTFAGFEMAAIGGVPVLHRRDDRCKTFRVSLLWQRQKGDGQAARALLPALLQHGAARHGDRPAMARAREQLYGAGGGCGLSRHAETTILGMTADAVAGAFLPGRPDQFGDVLTLIQEQLLTPRFAAEGGGNLFERERAQALAAARAVFDDKAHYARQRAISQACAGEPYGVLDSGGEPAIAALRADEPAAMLVDFLAFGRCVVLMTGQLPDAPLAALEPLLASLPPNRPAPVPKPAGSPARPPTRTTEHASMQQGKLVLVFRLPPAARPAELAALQVALSLWGGGAHSRLFQEVREKRSLCYYAAASGDADKGLAMVQVGCDPGAVDAVVEHTLAQLAELAAGTFRADELATAVATCQAPYRAIDDAPASRLSFTAEQWLRGFDQLPTDRIAALGAVAAEAVAAAASGLRLDHQYALLPVVSA